MNRPLIIEQDCRQALARLARQLTAAGMLVAGSGFLPPRACLRRADLGGLRAVPSFDLCAVFAQPCPHHRNETCTCQTAVISVKEPSGTQVALVIRGHEGRTTVTVIPVTFNGRSS